MSDGRAFIVRLLEWITAFFLLLFVVLRLTVSGDMVGLGGTIYVSMPVWVAFTFWLFRGVAAGRVRLFLAGADVCLLVLMLLVLTSPRPPANLSLALPAAMAWATNLVFLYLVINVGREARFARWILAALLATGLSIAVYGALQAGIILPHAQRQFQQDADFRRKLQFEGTTYEFKGRLATCRPQGTFVTENSLAGFLALVSFAMLGVLLESASGGWRRAARMAMWLLMLGVFCLCMSKGGWLGLFAGAYAFLWVRRIGPFGSRAVRWGTLGAGLGVALVLFALSWTSLDPLRTQTKHTSTWVRMGYWKGAARVFLQHPWLGIGLENFREHYYEVKDAEAEEVTRVHNDYLQVAVDLGVFGFLAFIWFWLRTVFVAARLRPVVRDAPPEGPVWLRRFWLTLASLGAGVLGLWLAAPFNGGFLEFVGRPYDVCLMIAVWVLAFLAVRPDARQGTSPWLHAGLLAGLVAALAHAGVDIHFCVHGLAFAIWAMAGVLIALCQDARGEGPSADLELGLGGSVAVLAIAAGFGVVLVGAVYPVMDRAQEEESILDEARSGKAGQPELQRAAQLAPWDAEPRVWVAMMRHQACLHFTSEDMLKTPDSGLPGVELPRAMRVDAVRHLQDLWQMCLEPLHDAIKLTPRRWNLWNLEGRFHEDHADRALALAAKEKGPQQEALESLARGEREEAAKAYQRAYELWPSLPENAWRLGHMLDLLGRTAEAEPYLRKALDLHRRVDLERLKLPPEAVSDLLRRFGGAR